MSRNERDTPEARPPRRDRFALFFYEPVGDQYRLRVTRFALCLILGLTVVPIAGLLVFFLAGGDDPPPPVIRIDDPRYTPFPMPTLPPPTFATPPGQGAGANAPASRRSPSPSPTPSETPVLPPDFNPPSRPTPAARRGANSGNTNAAPKPSPTGNANE